MILEILFLFMIYAIIGWLWETPYVSFNQKKYINRGFLRGPYIPIYGYASLTIILSMSIFQTMKFDSVFTIIVQILFISLISAVWEYFTSLGLEVIFKTRWWDYSKRKFNLNGRVALDYTILFGIGGYLLWRFINPIVEGIYINLPSEFVIVVLVIFYLIFVIDGIYTFRDLFRLRNIIIKLQVIRSEITSKYDYIFENAYKSIVNKKEDFLNTIGEYKSNLIKELNLIRNKGGNILASSVENKLNQLTNLLFKSKNLTRFYKKFPKSSSNSFQHLLNKLKRDEE